mgnify:CR=1 FL=1|tara:strand:- start:11601 stop:11801 length:201 start_codon:yes stop_codon:yes gene_type:complete
MQEFKVGDLVKSSDSFDKQRQLGMIVSVNEKVHLKSTGTAAIVTVYWFQIQESDWEYTFFLEKLDN